MIKKVTVFASLALVLGLHSAMGGDITGKVTLKGTAPAEGPLPMDPFCKKTLKPGVTPTTRFYQTDDAGGLADVFVYLKKAPATPTPSEPVLLDQVACEYTPYVIGAQVGQEIKVRNSDPVLHNVHPTSTVGNKEYNKAQLKGGPDLVFKWDKPEVFLKFKCDVHIWMYAYVGLIEHSYHATTKEDGTFTIKNVPAGEYEIEAVHRKTHPKGEGIVSKVTVGADGGNVDFVVDITK